MNRMEFMRQLALLLDDITSEEKAEAIQYYNDYFDDAGIDNEQDVIRALGTPAKVAETIKTDLAGRPDEDWEFTETGFRNEGRRKHEILVKPAMQNQNAQKEHTKDYRNAYQEYDNTNYRNKDTVAADKQMAMPPKNNAGKIILIVILLLLLSPLWISIAAVIFGILVSIVAVGVALLFSFGAVTVSLILVGIVFFAFSIVKLFMSPVLGILMMGISLLLIGIGILCIMAVVWICIRLIPTCVRGFVNLCRLPFERKGGQCA
ncbi:MAG: DUF1700 domain-containing protein [Lachnospiraceae bacterium]